MKTNQKNLPSQKFLAFLMIPMLIALGISGYLTFASLTASEIAGCGGGNLFDCGHVLNSKWSKFLGLPVSGLAVITYMGMITASIVAFQRSNTEQLREWAWTAVTGLAIAASMAAAYFIFLQVVVLQHLCWYCLVAHTCGIVIATTALWLRPVAAPRIGGMSVAMATGLAVLIAVQVSSEAPKKFKIETYNPDLAQADIRTNTSSDPAATNSSDDLFAPPSDDVIAPPADDLFAPPVDDGDNPATAQNDAKSALQEGIAVTSLLVPANPSVIGNLLWYPQEPQAKQESPKPKRRVVSFQGQKLDVRQWPLAGSPDANYIFVEMFDYTCPHCRKMHKTIDAAKKKINGGVSIVSLPVPMNRACNATVQRDNAVHSESCQLSNLAVGVWRVDAKKFGPFHDWMFKETSCPTYAVAYQKAAEMIGKDKLDAELGKGMAQKYVQRHIMLYQRVGAGQIPKTLFPTTSIIGEYNSPDGLADLIKQHAGE